MHSLHTHTACLTHWSSGSLGTPIGCVEAPPSLLREEEGGPCLDPAVRAACAGQLNAGDHTRTLCAGVQGQRDALLRAVAGAGTLVDRNKGQGGAAQNGGALIGPPRGGLLIQMAKQIG